LLYNKAGTLNVFYTKCPIHTETIAITNKIK
jgi:hypothetical protein